MLEVTLFSIFSLFILLKPRLIPYFAVSFIFVNGLASRDFIDHLKVTLGSINVYPTDILFALASIFALVAVVKVFLSGKSKNNHSPETKTTSIWALIFTIFYLGKLANGLFNNLPFDSVVRMFMADSQVIFFFLPLAIYNDTMQLKGLIRFTIILSLAFPLYQPFLLNSADTQQALNDQDTLRLGYGDGAILLGFGAIALLAWEYKKHLTFMPLSGLMMLGHRSSFIGIALAYLALAILKGKKIKMFALMGMAGILLIGALSILQTYTNSNLWDKAVNRLEQTFEPTKTTMIRAAVITIVIEEFEKRPFTGLDYRELHEVIKRSTHSARDFNIYHPHNFVYSSLMSTGILGSIMMFMIIFRSLFAAHRLAETVDFKNSGIFIFSYLLFFLVFSLMNTSMTTVGYVMWFLCGVTFLIFNKYSSSASQPDHDASIKFNNLKPN